MNYRHTITIVCAVRISHHFIIAFRSKNVLTIHAPTLTMISFSVAQMNNSMNLNSAGQLHISLSLFEMIFFLFFSSFMQRTA